MLAVTRKSGEWLDIETQQGLIRVLVVRVNGGKVRLGVDAPGDCRILRGELLARSGHDGQSEGSSLHDAGMATDGP